MFQGSGKDSFVFGKKFPLPSSQFETWDPYVEFHKHPDSSGLYIFFLYVDSFNTTVQFPLSACRILISFLSFRDYNAIDSFIKMLDVKDLDFSNMHRILQQNSIPKAKGSSDLADSAAHTMSKLLLQN
jgi:hypothetical protein